MMEKATTHSLDGAPDPNGGPCSAVQAEWLRRLRDTKQYKNRGGDWGEFCRRHVGLKGPEANRIIQLLEEFGPDYFNLAALAPVTPEEFRTVASKVKGRFFCANGEAVRLVPKNARKIASMVENLRQPAGAGKLGRQSPPTDDRLALLEHRCRDLTAEFRTLSRHQSRDVDRLRLAAILRTGLSVLGRIEMELGIY